jgi:glycosyltransferase involved in cell wall biosynthesis
MKSLLLVTTLLGGEGPTGVETHVRQIMKEAQRSGHDSLLITPYTGSRLARAPFRPLKNLRDEYGRILYRTAQAWAVRRQLRLLLRRHSGRRVTIYAQCPLTAKAAMAARAHRKSLVVEAVHYNISEAAEAVASGQARSDGPWASHLCRLEREHLPRVDRIAFVSEFMRQTVNARVPAIRSVPQATLPNFAAEPAHFIWPDPSDRDLIAIGTLEPRKNQAFLLRVLAECRRLGRTYSLTVVGSGPDLHELEMLTRSLCLESQVRFLGFQARAAELIPRHRVLVHAAKSENCPLIIAEALACGRPVMAPPVGGIPEMFRDRIEGRYWNLEEPASAAESLVALMDNPEMYASLALAARRRYVEAFSGLHSRWIQFLLPP